MAGESPDDGDPSRPLKIGEVAARAGVSRRTVDFYTGVGLLEPIGRTRGNFRLYAPEAVSRIRLVRRLKQQGVALADIAQALEGSGAGSPSEMLDQLDRQVHALKRRAKGVDRSVRPELAAVLGIAALMLREVIEATAEIGGGSVLPM